MADKKTKKERAVGTKNHTLEFYEAFLEAFRKSPGNMSAVSRKLKCTRRTARRVWEDGWKYDWAPAVKEVIEQEQIIARARMEQEDEAHEILLAKGEVPSEKAASRRDEHLAGIADRARAKEQAIKAKAEEGHMIEGSRKSVIQVEMSNLKLAKGVQLIAARVVQELEKMADSKKKLDLPEALAILKSYSSMVREAAQAAKITVDMEKLHMGEATQIIGLQVSNFDDADEATLRHEISKAMELFNDEDEVPEVVQH